MKFFKTFSIYTLASFIERGIAFFLLPIFTFYLTPKDFGYLSLVTSLLVFTQPLLTLGIPGSISVAYFKGEKGSFPGYFSSSLILPFILALILSGVLIIFKGLIFNYFDLNPIWILMIPLFCFFAFINSLLLLIFQINDQPFKYVAFSLSGTILNVTLSLLLVITFKAGFEGRLMSQYSSVIFFSLIAIFILFKKGLLFKDVRLEYIKDSLLFGLPLIPHIIGGMVISMSDKLFIDHFLGKEILGIYNIGFVMGSIISIFCGAFANAIIPFSYKLFAEDTLESKAKIVKVYWLFICLLLVIVFFVWLLTPFIFSLMIDHKFSSGSKYVIWITIGYFFQGLYLLFANIIFYLKRTKILFYWSFFNVAINFTLNYILINNFGAMGAAYAVCISYFIFFLAIATITHKIYPLPWLSFYKKQLT